MADQESRQIQGQQQGQADQPSERWTTQVGEQLQGGREGLEGVEAEGQYGPVPVGLAGEQMGLQTPEQAAAPVQAVPGVVGQTAEHAPVQAARREGPPPVFEAAVIERREGGFGGATIRIMDRAVAATVVAGAVTVAGSYVASQATQSPAGITGAGFVAGAMSLAAFYMGNRQQTDEAVRRAVERERHIQVEKIEEGSLLVLVKFLSRAGYRIMLSLNEKIEKGSDRTCLQLLLEDELQRIGWTGPIQVGMEGWWLAHEEGQEEEQEEEQDEAAGTEQEGERSDVWAGMKVKQSVPPSVSTEDSGLPEDVSSVAAMSITSAEEVVEGPLKWLRAGLQKHKNSTTARRHINAYRSWEDGAEILTSSGYTDLGGVEALVQGFMLHDIVSPNFTSKVLYGTDLHGQSYLNLNKVQLKQLMTSQLQADPTDSTCLLLTALQLPYGDCRVQTLQQVVTLILQHRLKDWLYQHLHHIYCYLGWAIWEESPQLKVKPTMTSQGSDLVTNLPALAKALSAMASSLMYKQDNMNTVFYTAILSKEVSETEAVRQFEHFLRLAPECDGGVPDAHYLLATLYNQQQNRQKVIHHFKRGQKRDTFRLPVFREVPRFIKNSAKKAYEQVMSQKHHK